MPDPNGRYSHLFNDLPYLAKATIVEPKVFDHNGKIINPCDYGRALPQLVPVVIEVALRL